MSESVPDPLVGREVDGYRIEEILGRGGMGVVYKATQMSLGRLVAIKVLPAEVLENRQFLDRFEREIDILARLSHPNIVTVFERGEIDGRPYIAMEYVRGTSLREVMRKGPLPPAEALLVVRSILSALEHAHQEGIVHRDIKPENVLVAPGGIVKVADFGLSRHLEGEDRTRLTKTYVALGTFEYMSPEQREMSRDADGRSDLYATGVVLYEMIAGELPIGAFEPLSRKRPQVCDTRIDEVVERSLKKSPDSRWQDAREMGDAVSRLLSAPVMAAGDPQAALAADAAIAGAEEPRWKRVLSNIFGRELPVARIEGKLPRKFAERVIEDVSVQRWLGGLMPLWPHFPGGTEFSREGKRLVLELSGQLGSDVVRDKRLAAAVGAVLEANAGGRLRRIAVADAEFEAKLDNPPALASGSPRPSDIPQQSTLVSHFDRPHGRMTPAGKGMLWALIGIALAGVGVVFASGDSGIPPIPFGMLALTVLGVLVALAVVIGLRRHGVANPSAHPNYGLGMGVTALWVAIVLIGSGGKLRDEHMFWLSIGAVASVFLVPRLPVIFARFGRSIGWILLILVGLGILMSLFFLSVGMDRMEPDAAAVYSVPEPAPPSVTTKTERIPDAAPIRLARITGRIPERLIATLESDARIGRWVQSTVPVSEEAVRAGIRFEVREDSLEMSLPPAWVRKIYLSHWRTGGNWRSNAEIYFHAIAAAYGRAAEKLAPGAVRRSAVAAEEFEKAMDQRPLDVEPLAVSALVEEPEGEPLAPFIDVDLDLARSESELPDALLDVLYDSELVRAKLTTLVEGADVIYKEGFDVGVEAGKTLVIQVPRDTQLALQRSFVAAGKRPIDAQRAVARSVTDFAAALAVAAHTFVPARLRRVAVGSKALEERLSPDPELGDPVQLPDLARPEIEMGAVTGELPANLTERFRDDAAAWLWIRSIIGTWPDPPRSEQVSLEQRDKKLFVCFDEEWAKRAFVAIWHNRDGNSEAARELLQEWLEGVSAAAVVTLEARYPGTVKRTRTVDRRFETGIEVRPFTAK